MLAVFIGLHLANHALALHSIAWHQWGMSGLRRLYRQPMAEAVLLLAVCWQVGSGGVLIRRRWARAASFFERVQGYSGLYLVLFLLVYVGAVLAGRYVWHVDTNFYFAAQGLNTAPWHWFFGPYYVLAVGAVFSHLAAAYYQHWGNRARARTEALWIMGAGWCWPSPINSGAFCYPLRWSTRFANEAGAEQLPLNPRPSFLHAMLAKCLLIAGSLVLLLLGTIHLLYTFCIQW